MEDQVLSSMCVEPVSYYTFAEQRKAFTENKCLQREISHDHSTYICMIVPILDRHWVAIQITTTPFLLEQFPGQTFFSSRLRYGPCCCQIDPRETLDNVKDTVQKVIDSSYRSVCWNYSSSQCCTLDHPTNTDIEQCISVAKAIFQAYTQPHIETPPSPGQPNSISNHNALDGRSCCACVVKRKIGTEPTKELITAPSPKKQRVSKVERDRQLVQSTVLWLKNGLKDLSVESFPMLVTSDILPTQTNDEACVLADRLWKLADEIENASAAAVWSTRYIAACSSLIGTEFTSSSKQVMDSKFMNASRQSISNWQGLVQIVNSIVNLMLPSWKNEAYLIYHVFAVKGHLLSNVARMSEERRMSFASGVANALGLTAPTGFERVSLFNPTRVLSSMFPTKSHEEICKAISLSSAMNSGAIDGEKPLLIPNMITLSRRMEDWSVLLALLKSGHSTPDLSSPPTPTITCSTKIGVNMGGCNTDKASQYQRGVNFAQCLVAPAEVDQSKHTLLVTHDSESPTTATDIGANSTQVGDASLAQVGAASTMFLGIPIPDTDILEGTRAPSPVLTLDSVYDFDGSTFENSDFFRPLLNLCDEAFDGGE